MLFVLQFQLTGNYEYVPCEDNYAHNYLNSNEVKASIHVNTAISWAECSDVINYSYYDRALSSTVPIYNYLIDGGFGLNILVYSGDDDSVCGTIGIVTNFSLLSYTLSIFVCISRHSILDLGLGLLCCRSTVAGCPCG